MTDRQPHPPLPSEAARLGSRVGGYRLREVVGRGGMGVVYRATAPGGDVVALKLMLPDLAISYEFRERFVREAELGPRLKHPHIVEVIDAGEDDGELFIAMQLVEGPDLKAFLEANGPLTKDSTVGVLRQAADALDYAHQNGVVHLDVKPQNILLEPRGVPGVAPHVYVTDFGLLRPTADEQTTTKSGQIYGSLGYISPERIENLPLDGRADVYSLACVAYECFTGEIPFDRANEMAVLWAHVHEEPPRLSAARRDLPLGLDAVLFTALAKRPEDRYLTCGDFVEEMSSASAKRRSRVYPIVRPLIMRTPRKKEAHEVWSPNYFPELARVRAATQRPNWAAIALFLILLVGSVSIQLLREGGIPQAVSDVAAGVEDLVPRVLGDGGDEEPAAEEGVDVAASARRRDRSGLPEPPRPAARQSTPLARADGSARGPAAGGAGPAPSKSAGGDPPPPVAASAGWLTFTATVDSVDRVFVMRADGSGVTPLRDAIGWSAMSTLSPNGGRIVYSSSREQSIDLYVMDVEGETPRRITPKEDGLYDGFPDWSPDGKSIVLTSTDNWENSSYEIRVLDIASGRITSLTRGHDPAWSPDGRKIVFERGADIYTINRDGTGERRLTSSDLSEWQPNWSPDGKSIVVFASKAGGDYTTSVADADLYTIDARTGQTTQLTSTPGRFEERPCWLPDGSGIAVEAMDATTGRWDIWIVSPDGDGAANLTRGGRGGIYVDCGW